MKKIIVFIVVLLPLISFAGEPEKLEKPSEVVICIGPGEKHNGTVTQVGNAKEYGCDEGPKCCAYFNTITFDFTLNLVSTIRPVTGVGQNDYSYNASTITITSTHTVLEDIDPCGDPQYEYLCFE